SFEYVLKTQRASSLAILPAGAASFVSPTAVKKHGVDYALQPVGTGPFRYVAWDRGQRVVLERNAQYWKSPVKVERVIYRPIVEDQARLTELLTGALDLIVGTPPDFVAQLENNPKVTLLKQVGAHVWYLGINNQKKPFDDKRVRQALNYAVNEDPDMVMYPLLHSSQWTPGGPNRALYNSDTFDELLHQARLTTDQAKRAELYRQAQRILADDPPWIFVDHEIQTAVHSKRVQ